MSIHLKSEDHNICHKSTQDYQKLFLAHLVFMTWKKGEKRKKKKVIDISAASACGIINKLLIVIKMLAQVCPVYN